MKSSSRNSERNGATRSRHSSTAETKAGLEGDSENGWIRLWPPFTSAKSAGRAFVRYAVTVGELVAKRGGEERDRAVDAASKAFVAQASSRETDCAMLEAAGLVLTDLARQGWRIRAEKTAVYVSPPTELEADPLAEKQRVRNQELVKRNEQLAQTPVQDFVRYMEKRRLHKGKMTSVLSLLRDGRELATAVRAARQLPAEAIVAALDAVVDPYLQFVTEDEKCEWTGLRLMDIWRYFRHGWSNQYVSVPGRTMMFLVRDRAAPMHPVMGIGALSSPIVQIRERDTWIGWHPSVFVKQVLENPTEKVARWLLKIVDTAVAEIYTKDLIEDELVSRAELRKPTPELIGRLLEYGREQREKHHRFVRSKDHKTSASGKRDKKFWETRARSNLFRSKRALTLADLLHSRIVMTRHFGAKATKAKLKKLLSDPDGIRVVTRILRKAKGDRVGIVMADISVCGAVQPYNPVLGGKLVAMLATSPEVVVAYKRRYGRAESEIASAMTGRPMVRPPELVFLGTTSLYGVGSSQYNRITIPADRLGGLPGTSIRYEERGRSEAYGTSQFGDATVASLVKLASQSTNGIRVNSIFGEGVSPKLRKIRDGLDLLSFPADQLLRHGRRRVIYCVTLIRNTRDFLIGIDRKPDYLVRVDRPKEGTAAIASWWKERWFRRRVESEEVLAEVVKHTLIQPIRHGARVVLPDADQLPLFE